ncbi:MAG: glycosyltransferase family 4 protein [Fimbriimonas sp.]
MPLVAIDARLVGGTSTGDSTYWTGLLHGLARTAPDARFLLFSNADRPPGIPEGPFHWHKVSSRSGRWWSLVAFPLAARRAGARAIHTQYTLSPLVGRRGITTVHDVSFLIEPTWFQAKDRLLMSRTVPASIRRAAATITVSETSRAEIERLVPGAQGRVRVTYNACPPWIAKVEPDLARARVRELGIEGPFALTVSTRWPRKNMRLAVDAVDLLPEDLPHRLVVTGKAGWGDQSGGRRTVPVGYVDEPTLSALYSAADLYLCPSRHEGFGVPLLEAFRCGCPVLCSAGGALPEVAGDAAAIERSWEAADWARRIEGLLRERGTLDGLRQRGYARERRFSWEETARGTLAVYREVGN